MELSIMGSPYAEVEVDLIGFGRCLSKNWDLEKAVYKNTKIIFNNKKELDVKFIKSTIWCSLDWVGIMEAMGKHNIEMKVKFFIAKYSDWIKLYPGFVKMNKTIFSENKESGYATFLVQDLIKDINFDLKSFIKNGCYQFASTEKDKLEWVRI